MGASKINLCTFIDSITEKKSLALINHKCIADLIISFLGVAKQRYYPSKERAMEKL